MERQYKYVESDIMVKQRSMTTDYTYIAYFFFDKIKNDENNHHHYLIAFSSTMCNDDSIYIRIFPPLHIQNNYR